MLNSARKFALTIAFASFVAAPAFAAENGDQSFAADNGGQSSAQTGIVPAPTVYQHGPVWLIAWAGGSMTDNFGGGFLGAVAPLNGDYGTDGFLFRVDLSAGSYRYRTSTNDRIFVETDSGDFMIGYKKSIGQGWISAYVGPAFENHDNPDPAASVRGMKWGIKGQGELNLNLSDNVGFTGFAYYASPYESSFILGKLGFDLSDHYTIGPEVSAFWHKSYDDRRFGGFVDYHSNYGSIGFSGGYLNATSSGGRDGYYLNAYWSYAFN